MEYNFYHLFISNMLDQAFLYNLHEYSSKMNVLIQHLLLLTLRNVLLGKRYKV